MKFFIGSDSGSGQKFVSKEAFFKELELMIADCEANGGTQFDVTVDADASCFYDPSDEDDSDHETVLAEFTENVNKKRETCGYGYYGEADGHIGTGYFCKKKNNFVTGMECYRCKF